MPIPSRDLTRAGLEALPSAIGRAGEAAAWRFVEFFAATIRNRNTRAAYAQAVMQFFAWCEKHRVHTLEQIKPVVIAAYIENHPAAAPTVKQHLAAIRMLFDFLVTGQVIPMNPAASVWTEVCREAREDAGTDSPRSAGAPRFDKDRFRRRPTQPGSHRPHVLHLRARLSGHEPPRR